MSPREPTRSAAPGADHPVCVPDGTGHCSVCGDEGLVGTVLEVTDAGATARVRLDEGGPRGEGDGDVNRDGALVTEAALDLVDAVAPGDRIVVHMGFAIATVRADEDGTPPGRPGPDRRPSGSHGGRGGIGP